MFSLNLPALARPLKLLCLGAHSDDIEIGCGGLVMTLIAGPRPVEVTWVVFSGSEKRQEEARHGAALFLAGAHRSRVILHSYKDGFFPYDSNVKQSFEELKPVDPDIVLTHYRHDRHQDHRMLSDLAWNTFRDHLVFEYEIPKFDGDFGIPNLFMPITSEVCARKIEYLTAAFGTQRDKDWFTDETFKGVMRLRGMECRAPEGYAEAFYSRKVVLSSSDR
jgi:LmbE family N-acetylglucosaminyl deacetylase